MIVISWDMIVISAGQSRVLLQSSWDMIVISAGPGPQRA